MTPVVETLTGGILNQVKKNLKKKIASSKFVQKSPTPLVCFFRRDLFLGVSCHFVFFSGAPGSVSVSPYTGSPPGLFPLVDPENRRTLIYFSGVRICHGHVPGIISLQVIRDGIPQLGSIVPFAYYWYMLRCTYFILVCFLPHQKCFRLFL